MTEEKKKENEKEDQEEEDEEKLTVPDMVLRTEQAAEAMKKQLDRGDKFAARLEAFHIEKILSGKSDASDPDKKQVETDAEYTKRVMTEGV